MENMHTDVRVNDIFLCHLYLSALKYIISGNQLTSTNGLEW